MHVVGYRIPDVTLAAMPLLLLLAAAILLSMRSLPRAERVAVALFASTAVGIVVVTLAPVRHGPQWASGRCSLSAPALDLGRWHDDQRLLNLLMYVPIGLLGIALWRLSVVPLGIAVALPLVVEAVQRAVPHLGRSCDAVDVYDNVAGALIGAASAAVAVVVNRRARDRRHRQSSVPSITRPAPQARK